MLRERIPRISQVNILYLIVAIAFVTIGSFIQLISLNIGLLFVEIGLLVVPTVLFLINRYSIKYVLRLNPIKVKQLVYIFFIMIFAYPVALFLNYIIVVIVTSFTEMPAQFLPVSNTIGELLQTLFFVAVLPGVCEEIMFRGLIQSTYTRLGEKKAIYIAAVLFGIFHFNIMNLMGPIFLGIVLGYILKKTNSLYGPMFGHFINNTIAILIAYFVYGNSGLLDDVIVDPAAIPNSTEMLMGLFGIGVIAFFSFLIMYLLIKKLPETPKTISQDIELYDVRKPQNSTHLLELEYLNQDSFELLKEQHIASRKKVLNLNILPVIIVGCMFIVLNYLMLFPSVMLR